ncbi:MAG TPA: Asp-tRNA(Asn)/Glu-tRNA(Gln) amidotransferase subunit GatC [Burkholderiales bacterium]|nr:Asp-tRNA(Asn)/Glu-tRNA(Gln) amidotransferase subunit GatC [Burkholderiales bacterium]
MSLSDDQVRRLARLARIDVRADESAAVLERLNRILGLVDEMRRVDTGGIEPMSHALDLVQPLRVDSVTEPAGEERWYLVPKVIE